MSITSRPTLADVAHAAGVSTATVSRCLNAPAKVSSQTRQRVQSAVDAMSYTPNFAARAMAVRRTRTIGAVIPTLESAIFSRGLQTFQEVLQTAGYTLIVASSAYRPEVEARQIASLVSRGADGLLLIGYDRPEETYAQLRRLGVPALLAWAHRIDGGHPTVGFDNRAAMAQLAGRVLDLGHRRLGILAGIGSGNDRARDRVRGVQDAVAARSLDPDDIAIVESPYGIEAGSAAFARLWRRPHPPSAVICGNDVLAVGALCQARRMGLRVPDDVSITGFDDLDLSRITTPPLTTVRVPHNRMGTRAAATLVAMIEGGTVGPLPPMPCEILMRGSLAAPARATSD